MSYQEEIDDMYRVGAEAETVMREPLDRANPWAWAQRQKQAMEDHRRFCDWKRVTGPLGVGIICQEGQKHVRVVPYQDGPYGTTKNTLHKVLGCAVRERCDCQAKWDTLQRDLYDLENDGRAQRVIAKVFDGADVEEVIKQLTELGHAEHCARRHIHKLLPE